MGWFGTGKSRTKFGMWLDGRGIKQRELSTQSGVSEDTITRLSNDTGRSPSLRTRRKLERVLRDKGFQANDFWGPMM